MKTTYLTRRRLVQGFALAGTLTAAGWPAISTAAAKTRLRVQPLAGRLSLVTGAGGNVVLFRGDNALTVIDSGSRAMADELVATIEAEAGDLPVRHLFNTHWHEDHTGGNEAIRALGADIIAHENTRLWLGADFDVEWRHWHHEPRPPAAQPDETFYESGSMDLGGETVHYLHFEQAHTDGDIALYFPTSNVLVAGGLVSDGTYPITDIATGGWIGGLIEADKGLMDVVDPDTVIVPATGPAKTTADLEAQLAMLEDLYGKMKALAQEGFDAHNMLDAKVTADYDAKWGDPTEFVMETYRGMWAHTYDMGGFI